MKKSSYVILWKNRIEVQTLTEIIDTVLSNLNVREQKSFPVHIFL